MSTVGKLDPTLKEVLRLISDMTPKRIEIECGVSASTIRNWRNGKVRRPQNITMEFTLRAAGYQRVIVPINPKGKR